MGAATEVQLIRYHSYTSGTPYVYDGKSSGVMFPPGCVRGVGPRDRRMSNLQAIKFGGPGQPSQEEAEWLMSNFVVM